MSFPNDCGVHEQSVRSSHLQRDNSFLWEIGEAGYYSSVTEDGG